MNQSPFLKNSRTFAGKKAYWTIIVLIVLAFLVIAAYYEKQPNNELNDASKITGQTDQILKTYTNSKFGYSFQYPGNLFLDNQNEFQICTQPAALNCSIELRKTKIDKLVLGVAPEGVEGKDWTGNGYFVNISVQNYNKQFIFDQWIKNYHLTSAVNKNELIISGAKGYEFSTTDKLGGDVVGNFPTTVVPYNKKLYFISLSYNNDQARSEGYKVYDAMKNNFKFLK